MPVKENLKGMKSYITKEPSKRSSLMAIDTNHKTEEIGDRKIQRISYTPLQILLNEYLKLTHS